MKRTLLTLLLCLGAAATGTAENVDLVTLPRRDTVQLTIYNTADLTLVRETRHLTLKKGRNELQFSWANTLIDPTSVSFRPLEHRGEIELETTVFPGQKPQHLVWLVDSKVEGEVRVEVSYFTSGLTWRMDYVATADQAEENLRFTGHVRVFNNSGEEYEDARIRLIVGKINLVEKIAELARRRGMPPPAPKSRDHDRLRKDAAEAAFGRAGKSARREGAKKIVKEGVSEYFMFTVEGEETVRNGWSKRMPAVRAKKTPFAIVYRLRPHQYGPRPVRFFVWKNDEEHSLGESPLPDGRVRLFRENGRDGLAFLGDQRIRYVPVAAPIEVNLGPDDLVVAERTKGETTRNSFRFDNNQRVVGWDEHVAWTETVRNYRDEPIRFELHRVFPGDVELTPEIASRNFDYRTLETSFDVGPRAARPFRYRTATHHGTNRKQNRLLVR